LDLANPEPSTEVLGDDDTHGGCLPPTVEITILGEEVDRMRERSRLVFEMNGVGREPLEDRAEAASLPSRRSRISRAGAARAVLLLLTTLSFVIAILVVYRGRVAFSFLGLVFQSSELFRPLALASVGGLTLHLLAHRDRRARRPWLEVAALFLCLDAYAFHFGSVPSGDVVPAEYTALSMVAGRGSSLDGYPELVARGVPYYLAETPRGLRSAFPLGPSLLAWPLFVPARFLSADRPATLDRIGSFAALLLAVACVYFVLQIARRLDPPFSPYWVALIYGLGSSHWLVSSSALWQHGPGELWVLGALERLLDRETRVDRRLAAAGAAIALAVATRPSLVVSAFVFFLLALWMYRREAGAAVLGAAAIALPVLYYHLSTYGSVLGAYGAQTHAIGVRPFLVASRNAMLLLASPSRGVLWFEPVVLFTLGAAFLSVVRRRTATLLAGVSGFALLLFLYANHDPWWGGHSVGPRYLTDALPWWVLALSSLGASRSKPFQAIVVSLAALGALASFTGTTKWAGYWNSGPSVDDYPERLETFDDSQLLFQLLSSMPGAGHLRTAVFAENDGDLGKALASWRHEREVRPWNRHAARRVVDLLVETDRLAEAEDEVGKMARLWPSDPYFAHLTLRLPAIREKLEERDWKRPAWARAARNQDLAPLMLDESLGTSWSTVWLQGTSDWLELGSDPDLRTTGVALFYAPEFGEGPSGLCVHGVTPEGGLVALGDLINMSAERKGWVVIRFPALRLAALRLSILRNAPRRFSVSEARLLTER
jgi:hypothetical protein